MNNKGKKYKQQGPQQKPQTYSERKENRHKTRQERIPKGWRNQRKTGTKGAQTTDNRTEGSTEENDQWNTRTEHTHKKDVSPPNKIVDMGLSRVKLCILIKQLLKCTKSTFVSFVIF